MTLSADVDAWCSAYARQQSTLLLWVWWFQRLVVIDNVWC